MIQAQPEEYVQLPWQNVQSVVHYSKVREYFDPWAQISMKPETRFKNAMVYSEAL